VQILKLGSDSITSFYDLLGNKENNMTFGLGFVLSKCSAFLKLVLDYLDFTDIDIEYCSIHLQHFDETDRGFSDIEIWYKGKRLLIIEAKKGWNLPSHSQLEKYNSRFTNAENYPSIAVLSECSNEYAMRNLDQKYLFISWQKLFSILKHSQGVSASTLEKNHLHEYSQYLSKVIKMDREHSNLVYVVSLSGEKVNGSESTYIEIVTKYHKYFFPYNSGGGWPAEAPNYIAFRYDGKLQSIHKVVKFEVNEKLSQSLPGIIKDNDSFLHMLLHLGVPIIPNKEIRTGGIFRNGRVWCMIDTLLTCDTIAEARDLSNSRIE